MLITEPMICSDNFEESSKGLKIVIQEPQKHSTIFKPKNSWDSNAWTTYFNLVQINPKTIHMYYRGNLKSTRTNYHYEYTCVLVSTDGGYTFTQPSLQLIPYKDKATIDKTNPSSKLSSKKKKPPAPKPPTPKKPPPTPKPEPTTTKSNIIWKDDAVTHNFFAFKNPKDSKLMAIGSLCASSCRCCGKGIWLLESDDGFKWQKKEIVINGKTSVKQKYGTFYDTMNTVTWDPYRNEFRAYLRYNEKRGVRRIQFTRAKDLTKWEKAELLEYAEPLNGNFYTTNIMMYPNSYYYVGFPSFQTKDNRSSQTISMLFSRDGHYWNLIKHKWLGQHSLNPERFIPQILESPDKRKFLLYINSVKNTTVDLYTMRKDGFACLSTANKNQEEWVLTRAHIFTNVDFFVNYKFQNAEGNLTVNFYDDQNRKIFTYNRFLKPDEVNFKIVLPTGVLNRKVKIKFIMRNCDLYSYTYHSELKHLDLKSKPFPPKSKVPAVTQTSVQELKAEVKKKEEEAAKVAKAKKEENELQAKINELNKILAKKPAKSLRYSYTDLLKPGNNDPKRIFNFKKPLSKIESLTYGNFNRLGGGNPQYGRTAVLKVIYRDKTREEHQLIKNSRSNCKLDLLTVD